MDIIIVGCGKTGCTIARYLNTDKNNIVMIDKKPFDQLTETLDVMVLQGNGISRSVLEEAGAAEADMVISVLPVDEANVVCCRTAKLLGAKYVAARVSDPEYALELYDIRRVFGIDMILNRDQLSALAVSRLLRYPGTDEITTFANGYIEMVSFHVSKTDCFEGMSVEKLVAKYKTAVVFAVIKGDDGVSIPRGDSVLHAGDLVSILGRPGQITDFFRHTKKSEHTVKDVMIIGGGRISFYLARLLTRHGISTKIIEKSQERCEFLSETLLESLIIHGDGTDQDLLFEESIGQMDAIVCLTDRDEENIVLGLYGQKLELPNVVVKVNHLAFDMASDLVFGNVISPEVLLAEQTAKYITGLRNAEGKDFHTSYTVFDSDGHRVKVLEFEAHPHSQCLDIPLKKLKIKRGVIIGSIIHKTRITTPTGDSVIHDGDIVIVVTNHGGISMLDDILTYVNALL